MLRDESRAQDAVQEVFLSLVKNVSRIKDEFPSSLLFRMATNVCLNILKREKKLAAKDDLFFNNIEGRDDFAADLEAKETIGRLFAGEKPDMLTLAIMRYVDKLAYEDIAATLGLSVSGVRKRLHKLSEKAQAMKADLHAS